MHGLDIKAGIVLWGMRLFLDLASKIAATYLPYTIHARLTIVFKAYFEHGAPTNSQWQSCWQGLSCILDNSHYTYIVRPVN